MPSGLWRVALALGFGLGWSDAWLADAAGDWTGRAYLIALALVAEAFALLTLGLVQPWGEVLPRWVPVLGGRRIPPAAAIVPAALGSLALMAMWTGAPLMFTSRYEVAEQPDGNWKLLMAGCYLPLMFWGPLLAAVTWAYYRRRCTDRGAA